MPNDHSNIIFLFWKAFWKILPTFIYYMTLKGANFFQTDEVLPLKSPKFTLIHPIYIVFSHGRMVSVSRTIQCVHKKRFLFVQTADFAPKHLKNGKICYIIIMVNFKSKKGK